MSCVPDQLSPEDLDDLVVQARDCVYSHGILYRRLEDPNATDLVTHAPFTLFPSYVPRDCFEQAKDVQTVFNVLMHRVAHDYDFLKNALENTIQVDDFTRRMWEIYEFIREEGITQPLCLGLHRSDYMINWGDAASDASSAATKPQLRQIEFNTMSASFGGLSQQLSRVHKYILGLAGMGDKVSQVPDDPAVDGLGATILAAWQQYSKPDSVIVFLVVDGEANIYDQRYLEYAIKERNSKVKVIRRTIRDMYRAVLTEDKRLLIDTMEVAVVYFRTAYSPDQMTEDKDWEARLQMERSRAICCPNIYYHLAGTKKVQQVLAQPGMVERFLTDPEAVRKVRKTFAGLYSLDMTEDGDRAVYMAMEHPEKFVLKPQREGGGNNTYGEDIRKVLSPIAKSKDRTAYILMERIWPRPSENYPIKRGTDVKRCKMVNELGVFGLFLGTNDNVILNAQQGHNLRTKVEGMDEGGVATGYSCLDSPFLV